MSRIYKDHRGKKFNQLRILEFSDGKGPRGETLYLCLCDCGVRKIISGARVVSGLVKSCGHAQTKWPDKDLQFLKDNYSTALSASDIGVVLGRSRQSVSGKAFELGLKKFIAGEKGCSVSGCPTKVPLRVSLCRMHYQREYKSDPKIQKKYQEYAFAHSKTLKGRFTVLTGECKRRRIPLDLNFEDFVSLWERHGGTCIHCNSLITQGGPSLDRINNDMGYSIDNCVLSCGFCNRLRGELLGVGEMAEVVSLLKKLRNSDDIWAGFSFSTKKRKYERTGPHRIKGK